MRLPQLQRPMLAAVISGGYRPVLASFALPIRPAIPTAQTLRIGDGTAVEGRRYASVKSQGAYRIPNKKTIAKKLGAKRSGDQFVIPGNIIFKQRGTIWHAGFNALRGRDHTIHAAATGYVKYYRDPDLHPHKQYIGVAFNKEDTLPYPKNEPRRRKLGMVAHVRKTGAGPRPAVNEIGIPNRVLRKAGLYNMESLERRLWNAEKRKEMRQADAANAKAAKAGMKGVPEEAVAPEFRGVAGVTTATSQPALIESPVSKLSGVTSPDASAAAATSGITSPDADAAAVTSSAATETGSAAPPASTKPASAPTTLKIRGMSTGRPESPKRVTAGEYLQKSWQERRHTKVLLLNPRNYSYAESNAAIGRLSSKTMYTPTWKLGGRKSRFRSRRKRAVAKRAEQKANKELVRAMREKERVKEEKKLADKLAKQRARGRKSEEKAAKAEGKAAKAEEKAAQAEGKAAPVEAKAIEPAISAKDTSTPVGAQAIAPTSEDVANLPSIEAKEIEKPVETQETARPVEIHSNAESVEAKETEKPVKVQETVQPVEIQSSAEAVEAKKIEIPIQTQETAQPVEVKSSAKPVEAKDTEQSVEVHEPAQPSDTKESSQPPEGKKSDEPVKP